MTQTGRNNVELPDTNLSTFLLLLIGRKKRLRVVGRSMLPLLKPGEEILFDSYIYRKSSPQINDIIVAIHPNRPNMTIVKRIDSIERDGKYFLLGDNPRESTDSRHWGAIEKSNILAKVTNRFT